MSALPKIINALLVLPITIICALWGTLIFVMGMGVVLNESDPRGIVFILWYLSGVCGIVGLWKLALRFQWKKIVIKRIEWILLSLGFLACAPFPTFIFWNPNDPYGFVAIYFSLAMALVLSISLVSFGMIERNHRTEPGASHNGGKPPRES
jgi:hypothetical protein